MLWGQSVFVMLQMYMLHVCAGGGQRGAPSASGEGDCLCVCVPTEVYFLCAH